jgi:hypothetical protein
MLLIVNQEEITKSNQELADASARGFSFSEAIFDIVSVNDKGQCSLKFTDIILKADSVNKNLNWGRQGSRKKMRLANGKLEDDG